MADKKPKTPALLVDHDANPKPKPEKVRVSFKVTPAPKPKPKRKRRKKMGRPRITIKKDMVELLSGLHCTIEEAAGYLGVSEKTFRRRLKEPAIRELWDAGLMKGNVSLRRLQFELAKKSAAMAIFLGKQYLGQRDEIHQKHSGEDGGPIPFTIDLSGVRNIDYGSEEDE